MEIKRKPVIYTLVVRAKHLNLSGLRWAAASLPCQNVMKGVFIIVYNTNTAQLTFHLLLHHNRSRPLPKHRTVLFSNATPSADTLSVEQCTWNNSLIEHLQHVTADSERASIISGRRRHHHMPSVGARHGLQLPREALWRQKNKKIKNWGHPRAPPAKNRQIMVLLVSRGPNSVPGRFGMDSTLGVQNSRGQKSTQIPQCKYNAASLQLYWGDLLPAYQLRP